MARHAVASYQPRTGISPGFWVSNDCLDFNAQRSQGCRPDSECDMIDSIVGYLPVVRVNSQLIEHSGDFEIFED